MRVLVTSSRMPFALGMVRKLAAEGREIYAADDHLLLPGNHPQREGLSGRLEVGATHDPEQPTFRISEDRRGQFELLQLGQ